MSNGNKVIPVFRPSYSEDEIAAVTEVLKSGWWGAGPKAGELENEFAKFTGTKHAISLSHATAALHLAGKLLNLPAGSEVITSPLTFISTAYLADYNNLKIVFADVDEDTLNINPEDIKKKITEKTKVILPVHFGGHACQMDEIMAIAKQHDLFVVEDCAHASGGKYKGKHLGTIGHFGCFSFQAVKNLATGDGGMLTTNNDEWAKRAKVLRWVGINKETADRTSKDQYSWEYQITEVGYKYQLCDILAAIGLVQLKRLEKMNSKRREITNRYNRELSGVDWIRTPQMKEYSDSANHNYVIKVDKNRDKLSQYLKTKGISTGVHYLPAYKHPVYSKVKADCPVAENVWKKILTLPLYPDMTDQEFDRVVTAIKEFN